MLKSCQYCGRIHDSKYICPQKEQRIKDRQGKSKTKADRFRWSKQWKDKRAEIRERDLVCRVCEAGLYDPERKYETQDLSVHHIDSIESAWDSRLDNGNLITLCLRHHEMAERGDIPKEVLKNLAKGREGTPGGLISVI